jgi:predicted Rossmann fold flavoprotein
VTVESSDVRFKLKSNLAEFESTNLVIATGGLSIPKMGATNFSYSIAKQFNIPVVPTRAGLVPFTFSDQFKIVFERLSGVSQEVIVSTGYNQFQENILFTHRGLSGPAALQLSSYWSIGESIYINLFPNNNIALLINKTKKDNPRSLLRSLFSKELTKKLIQELEILFWSDWKDKYIADIPDKILKGIAENLSEWELKPSGTEGFRTAEVTLGGIDNDSLSS